MAKEWIIIHERDFMEGPLAWKTLQKKIRSLSQNTLLVRNRFEPLYASDVEGIDRVARDGVTELAQIGSSLVSEPAEVFGESEKWFAQSTADLAWAVQEFPVFRRTRFGAGLGDWIPLARRYAPPVLRLFFCTVLLVLLLFSTN